MKVTYITKKIYVIFLLAVLLSAGCGPNNQSDPDPIGIKIKSPKFDEIAGIYTDVTPSLKFTSSSGGVTECNVFIGTDTKVKGTCGDMPFGTYAYDLEYRYQGLTIAKSIGSITIDENNTETPITLLDKNIDEDNDGCSNLQEVIVGSNPLVQDTCIPPPTDLTAKPISTTRIDLTWTGSSGATGYKIFRREGSDGADTEIGTSTQTSYSDTGLKADTTYCYKVSANGNGAESIPTDLVCGKTENGLVAFYPFNGNANDESGNGNNGVVNGATLTTDRFGNADSAYSFDGSDSISVPDDPALTFGSSPFTIATWMQFSILGSYYLMGHDEGGGNLNKWILWPHSSGVVFHVNSPSTGGYTPINYTGWTPQINKWYHVAIARSGVTFNLYIDGLQVSTGSDSRAIPDPNAPFRIGTAEGGHPERVFRGLIDDTRIYNRALTDAEVLALYNEGK